jgi:HAD superfamily hydrolase (TIGR01490 family)
MNAIAFFDFDETIVEIKSMFAFLREYADEYADEIGFSYEDAMSRIERLVHARATREEVNAFYYSLFKGRSLQSIRMTASRLWEAGTIPFIESTMDAIKRHKTIGDEIVVISGSSKEIIAPVLSRLGIEKALCSEPEIIDGAWSGILRQQAIGEGKASLVLEHCRAMGVAPDRCIAYGDHYSDRHMLMAVGRAVVVNPDPDLLELARKSGWSVLDSVSIL